jgi:hypothetical protein
MNRRKRVNFFFITGKRLNEMITIEGIAALSIPAECNMAYSSLSEILPSLSLSKLVNSSDKSVFFFVLRKWLPRLSRFELIVLGKISIKKGYKYLSVSNALEFK